MAELLANSDAFIHPNPHEPFGITPLEAMCSELPVVAPSRYNGRTVEVVALAIPSRRSAVLWVGGPLSPPEICRSVHRCPLHCLARRRVVNFARSGRAVSRDK
ncbi:MAG: glycosyltransferase [Terriglobia bacterium]